MTTPLQQRLRALRLQSGGLSPAPAAALDPAVRQLLSRHLRLQRSSGALQPPLPGHELAAGLRYRELVLSEVLSPAESIDVRFAGLAEPVARSQLFHFDTETTGLAGGVGTRAFMVGVADWVPDGLRIRQLTLTRMAAEPLMLSTLAGWLGPQQVLVSYNGKSYDAPLLATRYRLHGQANPLSGLLHVDLLHPVRRRWKQVWANCRLATAERQLLQVVRDDDLPGSQAPAAWLAYLRHGHSRDLCRVHEHNAQDLASLAGILSYVSALPIAHLPKPRRSAAPILAART